MNARNRPLGELLCAEPLEGRWLLSATEVATGFSPQALAVLYARTSSRVQVVEIGSAADDGGDRLIAVADLPQQIVDGLQVAFPGAKILSVDYSFEDGRPEYGVAARFSGRTIDVTLTPAGAILDSEASIASSELPHAAIEWLQENYPGAHINEAAIATEGNDGPSYKLTFTAGQQEIEALLRLGEPARHASPAAIEATLTIQNVPHVLLPAGRQEMVFDSTPARPVVHKDEQPPPTRDQAIQSETGSIDSKIDLARNTFATARALIIAEQLGDLLATTNASTILPQLAQMAGQLMPIDLQAVEDGFENILHEMDLLAVKVVNDVAGGSWVARLAMIAAFVAGVQLLVAARNPKGGPVLIFNAANSSWSWVVGSPTRRRS